MAKSVPRRKKKRSALYAPLSFIIICAALTFGLSVFFRVSTIEVTGNRVYTPQEVIAASGIETGDNLFFVNRFKAIAQLRSKLPYISEVSISRGLPNKLVIEVVESGAIAYVTAENGSWLINRSCRLLEAAGSGGLDGLIQIKGLTPLAPALGDIISVGGEAAPKVSYLAALLGEIEQRGIMGDIRYIDMSNVTNPAFDYSGRFIVKMGKNENIDYKLELLMSAVSQLSGGDAGTIDLSIDKKAHFSPN